MIEEGMKLLKGTASSTKWPHSFRYQGAGKNQADNGAQRILHTRRGREKDSIANNIHGNANI
jgi:hypothetical protein